MDPVDVRAMSGSDVARCSLIFDTAISRVRRDLVLPPVDASPGGALARIDYLLGSDPKDSVVAEVGGVVVGFAQATRRGNCWTLVHLFVDPDRQSSGVGTALLAAVHARGTDLPIGLIGSTADPRAMRAYSRLPGFRLHPTVRGEGSAAAPPTPRVRTHLLERDDALEQAAEVDLAVRGSMRTEDLQHLLADGYALRSIPSRGYAVVKDTSIATISAVDDEAAGLLLEDALVRTAGADLELPRMTANQDWAIAIVVAAGLRLRPWGPLMVRGRAQPPSPYLPHPALS